VPRKIVTIRFSKPEYEFIEFFAERWGVSISEAVRLILHEFVGMSMVLSNMPEARKALLQMAGLNGSPRGEQQR